MVSGMRSVVVDKIASVAQACGLSREVRISTDIPSEEGVVVVVEVLTNKSTYNTLELTSGRMAKVVKGDRSGIPATHQIFIPTQVISQANVDDFRTKLQQLRGR